MTAVSYFVKHSKVMSSKFSWDSRANGGEISQCQLSMHLHSICLPLFMDKNCELDLVFNSIILFILSK